MSNPSPIAPEANPSPQVNEEVTTGLDALRSFGELDNDLYISAEGAFFEEQFVTSRVVTSEENTRFIKKIEKIVRASKEYARWVGNLRNGLGLNKCSFFSGIDFSEGDVALEMHHCPLTLYEIVDIVINHRFAKGQAVTSMTIADEIIHIHLMDMVGVIPLSKSVHKLVHSGAISVHPLQVHGNWLKFLRTYSDGVTESQIESLLNFVKIADTEFMTKLDKLQAPSTPLLRNVYVPTRDDIGHLLMAPLR